jgi:hypothetical protein
MSNLKGKSMSELIHMYNELAIKLGGPNVTEFKNLAAARAAVETLEKKMTETTETTEITTTDVGVVTHEANISLAGDQKYNSAGKRGPNQGVGAFAKEQIVAGKTNAEVLAMIKEKFPAAKTTTSCIAYYRTALKKGPTGKPAPTPEELRAKAQALLDEATKAEAAAEAAKAKAEAEATAPKAAEPETAPM